MPDQPAGRPPSPSVSHTPASGSGRGSFLEEEFGLGDYVQSLVRHRTLIVAGVLLGALTGFGLATLRPVLYEGVTTMMVLSPTRAEATANIASYRAIIENLTSAGEVVRELELDRAPHRVPAQSLLEERVTVDPGGQESRYPLVLRIRVRLEDPELALEAARRLTEKAVALNERIAVQGGSERRDLLARPLEAARARLLETEEEFLSYQREAQIELLRRDTEAILDERQALLKLLVEIEGEKARLDTAEAELRRQEPLLPAARAVSAEDALRRSTDDQGVPVPIDPIDLSHPYINPVYQTLAFQIATSRANLAALEGQRRELLDVRKIGGSHVQQLSMQYERELEVARRQTAFERAQRVHDDLALRFEQAETDVMGTGGQIQIVDMGAVPSRPLSRGRARWMLLGLAGGLLIAGLGALALDTTRPRAGLAD